MDRRAKDVAMADPRGSQVDRGRHLLPTWCTIRLKIKMCSKEAIAEEGRLVDLPSHRRLLLLCASQCHNSLLVLDLGDEGRVTRESPG